MISRRDVAAGVGARVSALDELAREIERGERYEVSRIGGRASAAREIHRPDPTYDSVVKNLRWFLEATTGYLAPDWVYGFVRGRSTVQNAAQHLDQDAVLTMDLLRFFPTITTAQVVAELRRSGFDAPAATLCGRLTTIAGTLPIGLSTSPHLSNLVFAPTDSALKALADRHAIRFTRYVDDLTFSGALPPRLDVEVTDVLGAHGWHVNPAKTRLVRRGGAQYVTGLYVGSADGPFIPRRIKRRMRWKVHMIERVGLAAYLERFALSGEGEDYGRLVGWARYIAAVEPDLGKDLLQRLGAAGSALRGDDDFW
jgi:hypothetical protein